MDSLTNGFATLGYGGAQSQLPADMDPKTPVCIGQLNVTALILYPTPYLNPSPGVIPELDWALVRTSHDRNPNRPGNEDTIHIRTPPTKDPPGPGDDFGVLEQKVSAVLGPMMTRGLIRLDAIIKRGTPNLPILPLEALVFTPKGNIPVVGQFLRSKALLLDHPRPQRCKLPYFNPHNPPPGGWGQALSASSYQSRWSTPVSAKSVEVQRSQVEELFKTLQSGDELPECEAPPDVSTRLYPHQKKALTFLLEREREFIPKDGRSSLWQERVDPHTGQKVWYHIVTQREVKEEPPDCRGAILADDMGLGKTITCVSLIAATLHSAINFSQLPLEQAVPPPQQGTRDTLDASHFNGSVWGMPQSAPKSAKAKAKEARLMDAAQAEYTRQCRIKARSRATLIVCPLSTVANWEDQFREHWKGPVTVIGGSGGGACTPPASTDGSAAKLEPSEDTTAVARAGTPIRVYVYHGNARRPDPVFLANCDVVITTFSTLASEYSKQNRSTLADDDDNSSDDCVELINGVPAPTTTTKKKHGKRKRVGNGVEATSPLQSVHWFRVVLDEAHSIKEISTVACRASCDLMADRRLCLTGTPVQNKLDDVFALIKFLRLEPLDDKATWTEFIGSPLKYGQPIGVARLQSTMKIITLRRTKESKTSTGERILTLPPRRDELRFLKFDEEEQALYDKFFNESKAEFHELSHKNEVMKNYVGILQKILRLRQICDHVDLVKGKGLFGEQASYEETIAAIVNEGITTARAAVVFGLLREAATAQCTECGCELAPTSADDADTPAEPAPDAPPAKRAPKKAKTTPSRGPTRASSPATAIQAVLTRCQHLFCICCFRASFDPMWPDCAPDPPKQCSVCQAWLRPVDAVTVDPDYVAPAAPEPEAKRRGVKRERRVRGAGASMDFHPSTKVKALMTDLVKFSRMNPYSTNYSPEELDVQMVDASGAVDEEGSIVKTVVFSQWTSMLDKVEEALEAANIRYDRLDGTMKREDRSRAMDALKNDPACEVLLVSLKAGGVGLNLTAAQRVYLMDPYWNPAVENQAVDRIHRLGQTKPVVTVKLIIEQTIEARLLEVQKKKMALANMTLGLKVLTKEQLNQRRIEELTDLFG
ncbi:SNF2 family N-terminal domain-containing protein [Vararia minispora EC-137]|uniref:SNF2 family N-terminal domain-containing protein n=1 Tax=Vararia minispora EC-137 TaxID=1314806 RepID=A0ACB8QEG5_9AGAM|nr:SNF2 family N-terminal domain-containing protein [Vararia minispora EC-137]